MDNDRKKTLDQALRECAAMSVLTVLSALLLAGSIKIWMENQIVNSPGIFPTAVSAVMLFCSVSVTAAAVVRYRKLRGEGTGETAPSGIKALLAQELPFRSFFTMCMTVLYVVAFDIVGFYISTAVFLMTEMLVFYKGKHMKQSVLVTAGILIAVYVIIDRLFGIHF